MEKLPNTLSGDGEDKLVVCKDLNKYNKDQIYSLVEFQERFFKSKIITII